jgi:hypothetical protein
LDDDDDDDDNSDGDYDSSWWHGSLTLDVRRAVGIKRTVFCDVTPCDLVHGTDVSKGLAASDLYREVGGHRFFRNVSSKLSNCMASHTKRLSYC